MNTLLIQISLAWNFLAWVDAISGFFFEHFDESAQVGHSLELVVDLEDIAVPEVCLVKSAHVSRKVSQQELFAAAFSLPQACDFLFQGHCSNYAFYLFLAEILQPISLGCLIALDELLADPLASTLVSEVRTVGLQKFIELFDKERVVLFTMSLQCSNIYLLYPVFIDGAEDSVDVGFVNEALDHSKLLVGQDLLVDRLPDFLKFVIAFCTEVDAFEVEAYQLSECAFQLFLLKGGKLLRGFSFDSSRLCFNCPLLSLNFLELHLQLLVLCFIVIDHSLQFVLQLVFVLLVVEGKQSKDIFLFG